MAAEWEQNVVGTLARALDQAEFLRREVDHYQTKVDWLQNERPSLFGKKEPDSATVEKLSRNKTKLAEAHKSYDEHVVELCAIIEEVYVRTCI